VIGIAFARVFVQKLCAGLFACSPRGLSLVYGEDHYLDRSWADMSSTNATYDDGTVEQCIDELNDFFSTLTYSPTILAVALRVHLEALLQSLLEGDLCTREEVRELVRELEREALQ
jgi:hypothetical protein